MAARSVLLVCISLILVLVLNGVNGQLAAPTTEKVDVKCPCKPLYRAAEWTEGSQYVSCHILPTIESLKRRDPTPTAMVSQKKKTQNTDANKAGNPPVG